MPLNNNYHSLEFDAVLEKIAFYCGMDSSPERLQNEEVPFNPLLIERNLALTSEAMAILEEGKEVSFEGINDVRELLQRASKGDTLTAYELNQCLVFHRHCDRLKKSFKENHSEYLNDYFQTLVLDKNYREIEKMLDLNGKIRKDASEKLSRLYNAGYEINKRISEEAREFIKEHRSSLQEENSFTRNDRVTFLLKNADKNKYKGYRYGESSSGQAAYVEPEQFIELNNARNDNSIAVEEEIRRLLRMASRIVSGSADMYLTNYDSLSTLDLIFAKAKFGHSHKGILPEFDRDGELYLEYIAHPLIDPRKVVRNTYHFGHDISGIVISGSNTGGKTVSLKLIGLSVLMTYAGIPLIAEKAVIPLYDQVYADLEDDQSISNALSSFSAHLSKIRYYLENATSNSLVLIDEIGTGTDPKEAEALSLAILERFLERKIPFVLTTHYEEIKKFAYRNEDILLSAVGFDREKLVPTYRYYENTLGESNALKIAGKYLQDEDLLKRAEYYLESNRSEEEKALSEIKQNLAAAKENEERTAALLKEAEQAKQKHEEELRRFEETQEARKKEASQELDAYLEAKKEEAQQLIEEIRKSELRSDQLKKKTEQFEKINTLEVKEKVEPIRVGDRVRIGDGERVGTVISLEKGRAKVDLKGLSIDVKQKELTRLPPLAKKKPYTERALKKRVSAELNLVGMRVEEALPILEKYLDDAFGSKRSSVKIIHGIGTMALRNACRNYLKKCGFVNAFHDGDYYDGGGAVTIVEFVNGSQG